MRKKCIIIGSGLGGLSSGVILAKNGYEVTVLEQSNQIGGCLQCFSRKGVKFETGMHFIGSMDRGQTLSRFLNYLEVTEDIKLNRLDTTGYDIISLNGNTFRFPNGREPFIEQMATYFPSEKDNIVKYYDLVNTIAKASSLHSLEEIESNPAINVEYQLRSINNVLEEITSDPLLQNVLVGNLPLYAAKRDKTSFSSHAFIMDFYNQSAFRIVGGSDAIALSLAKTIERYGGRVLTHHKVNSIVCDDTKAKYVETEDGKAFQADYIISGIHPRRVMEMIDSKMIRPAFRKRLDAIPNTAAIFSVYIHFHDKAVPYMNNNYYGYKSDSPWACEDYEQEDWPKGYMYMHFCHEENPEYAESAVIFSYMSMDEMNDWKDTNIGRRGVEYNDFKKKKAECLISALENDFPGIKKSIANFYTSTPLSYRDYTGTEDGAIYGLAKYIPDEISCHVSHKTKIPNLFLAGQNTNSHGMLGVLVGSIVACSELVGANSIYNQIRSVNQ